MKDLHELPKFRDGLSFLYLEHCKIEQKYQAVEAFDQQGRTLIPAAALAVLMLGPGTSISHAAIKALADNGCSVVWTGEDGTRMYAQGCGETRRAYHLLHQAEMSSDPRKRLAVVLRMYRCRFGQELSPDLDLNQIRGMEGARMRKAYQEASDRYGVPWSGRNYDRGHWDNTDPINRALSGANALLNGLCHAAIVSGGYSPALGFIHTGKQLSFVYDVADLYKAEVTIPLAFRVVAESSQQLGPRVREACREAFRERQLLKRVLPDIEGLLAVPDHLLEAGAEADGDPACPEPLWSPPVEGLAAADDRAAAASAIAALEPVLPHPPAAVAPAAVAPAVVESPERQLRRQRAVEGLESGWTVTRCARSRWHVVTRPNHAGYIVQRSGGAWQCACPDFAKSGLGMCKHTAAIELVLARDTAG